MNFEHFNTKKCLKWFIFFAKSLANDVSGATGQKKNLIDNFFSFLKNVFYDILILTNFCPIWPVFRPV